MNNITDYILLEDGNGGYTTARTNGNKFYLCMLTELDDGTVDTVMEIDANAFNTLIQNYIFVNGSTPETL